jgi:hypothetical protein
LIISFELMAYCLIAGAVYLAAVNILWSALERFIPTLGNFPKNLVEPKNVTWAVSNFVIEFIFFVLMPSFIYGRFYALMPFSGVRGGVAVGLFLFLFGMIPFSILMLFRIKIPVVYVLYQLLGLAIKITGALAIIGYLYSL